MRQTGNGIKSSFFYFSRNRSENSSAFRFNAVQYDNRVIIKSDIAAVFSSEIISLPVAHGEGKFYAEKTVIGKIEKNSQVAARYCDKSSNAGSYPVNPNGSLNDIAGITDKSGKIFGLMPHPERFIFPQQWPYWPKNKMEPFGLKIFQNAVNYWK